MLVARQQAHQGGVKLCRLDWLDENLVGTLLNHTCGQLRKLLPGEHQHWNAWLRGSCLTQQLRGVAIGKVKVENERIRTRLLQLHPRVMAIGGFRDDVPLRREKVADSGANNGINVNDEDSILTQALTRPVKMKSHSRA